MRVNRTLLYAGIFLVAIGGVVVAADLGVVDEQGVADALGLWPLAVIALGLGLVLRRTRVSLGSGMLAAAAPGLLLGSAFTVAPRFADFCGAGETPAGVVARDGTFDGPPTVTLEVSCGSLAVDTASGTGWRLDARGGSARVPVVTSSNRLLSIASSNRYWIPGATGDHWNLTLPAGEINDLSVVVNAGKADIDLSGAKIDRLSVKGNAADVYLDGSAAEAGSLSGRVNFGLLSVDLANADVTGTFRVAAGLIKVCAPADLGLRVVSAGDAEEVRIAGVRQAGSFWESAGYAAAEHHAVLDVHVDLGAVEINPIGGCK